MAVVTVVPVELGLLTATILGEAPMNPPEEDMLLVPVVAEILPIKLLLPWVPEEGGGGRGIVAGVAVAVEEPQPLLLDADNP